MISSPRGNGKLSEVYFEREKKEKVGVCLCFCFMVASLNWREPFFFFFSILIHDFTKMRPKMLREGRMTESRREGM